MQNDYGDNKNQKGENRNAFEFVKEYQIIRNRHKEY